MSFYLDTSKPYDDNSQLNSQLDSQLIVVRDSSCFASSAIFIVMKLSSDLTSMRQCAFALHAQISWSADEYALYWSFVNNIWVHNHTERVIKRNSQKSYWYCRLWKNDADIKSEDQGRRAKRMRLTESCSMKLVIVKQFDEKSNLLNVTLSLHLSKKLDDIIDQHQHNHILQFLDDVKINFAIKQIADEEMTKKYTSTVINKNMQSIRWEENFETLKTAEEECFNLKIVHNASKSFKKLNSDARVLRAKDVWTDQWNDCFDDLQTLDEDVLSAKFQTVRNFDQKKSYAIAFEKRSRLSILMRRGHLTLMNSTHHTNQLKWKLFTLMIRDEHASWILEAHMLTSIEDDDIIKEFLRQIKRWARAWRLRYIIIDDSAAEQRGVSLAFRGLIDGEMKITNFLCRTHFERTLNRKLGGTACRIAKKHLYDALYFRKTKSKCDDSLKKTLAAASSEKRQYIKREWVATKFQWANYARQHSCLLLQCMTTNAVESWHASIKKHAEGELF